jgi:hypothetical protein
MAEMEVVYATTTASVATDRGVPLTVIYGTHWPANDPIVKRYPSLFSDDPMYGLYASVDPKLPVPEPEPAKRGPGRPPKESRKYG